MTTYRKRPTETTAVQLRWTTWNDVCTFLGSAFFTENPGGAREIPAAEASDTCGEPGPAYIAVNVRTAHGDIAVVRHGDWIIPEAEPGRFYPCKPKIFAATYEPISGAAGPGGVLAEIAAERAAQDARWGEQNHPDGTGGPVMRARAAEARAACQYLADNGGPDWRSILLEEVYEALAEEEPARLRAELLQAAAVATAWIEAIDRRTVTAEAGEAK
ncbi:hypothetical protein AB0904_27865 [Streptomyces sp. NPDC006684]|uniref:hypothetical protein n=1 Tax=Streptomyces sp. NPDC006684 TaxID=3154477 RepID=UPI003455ACCE